MGAPQEQIREAVVGEIRGEDAVRGAEAVEAVVRGRVAHGAGPPVQVQAGMGLAVAHHQIEIPVVVEVGGGGRGRIGRRTGDPHLRGLLVPASVPVVAEVEVRRSRARHEQIEISFMVEVQR